MECQFNEKYPIMDVVRNYDAISSPSAVTKDIYFTHNKMAAWKTKPANETFFCGTKPMCPLIGCHLGINAGNLGMERSPPIMVKKDLVSEDLRSAYQTMDILKYESVHETETHDMSSCSHALDGVLTYLSCLKPRMVSTGLNTQAMEKRSFDEMSVQEKRSPDQVGTRLDIGPIPNVKNQETSCPSEMDQSVALSHKPADKEIMTSSRTHQACQCCCHLPKSPPSHFPAFGLQNQRPSVIMVPVKWKRDVAPESSKDVSVLSDGDDHGEAQAQQYFRKKIDRTTARFKLSKSDWQRIPINTFPSGGRLLSGEWTQIFLSKVKETNPWCSLRFKNNHVRSENSRKIHSAVFFRGGAECKRPECNVKVRFVIRKEKGKYVDVTYVGDVCHSSQPGGSDVIDNKNRKKLSKARR